ncbi:MAG: amidohydrolase family protein [Candidatus Marinimicrobia bacterium]|jgi:imidazolonepropionase-like amidohydrolase|nr:amidohydrolase family protein [Candidatus Neomarinimicrobiota bacterium]MBT3947564.1 amidohydrolase family protein [Candidatus Neomarinimicrobiota bacterium]MBT4064534.1 amidohydrolase family protein [Candidatus Neomarinimicrobiota bacterium]MBT4308022.1 amidohydrolase family protein [Candidatus Neomarinimicrobiota bacterium]MBT4453104.1 amidohydrolase family protein [Candidatus Neomarinimicrobiota bacterium]|tara:strand:+ start:2402 stop:3673 length:1272 start_codon:yes stop_codon:yes gene_type:complete
MNFLKKYIITGLFCLGSLWAQQTIIHAGSLLDGSSKKVHTKRSIIIENGKIVDVKNGYAKGGEEDQVIDLKDATVMPGWIDLHVHLSGEMNPKAYGEDFYMNIEDVAYRAVPWVEKTLMAGFTTVRDLGGEVMLSTRNAIKAGYIKGPRIYAAGKALGTTGGHADPTSGLNRKLQGDPGPLEGVVNGTDDARKAVRQRYKDGSDLVKITATGGVLSVAKNGQNPQFTEEEIREVVKSAAEYEMFVAAHAHGVEGMQRAIRAGVRSIEHGTLMDKETARLMVKHGTYYVPTISAGEFVLEKAKKPGYFPEIIRPKALAIGPMIKETVGMAYKMGVKIAFGTDSGVSPHGDNADEFRFMVEAGMKPIDVINSATGVAAEVLGADNIGQIKKGMQADIVAVPGDPLKGISIMSDVNFVMKGGVVYK